MRSSSESSASSSTPSPWPRPSKRPKGPRGDAISCRGSARTRASSWPRTTTSSRRSPRRARSRSPRSGSSTTSTSWTSSSARSATTFPRATTASCRRSRPATWRERPASTGSPGPIVAHTDSRFELETLRRFVKAYQRVQPLGIGELWAVPIHLRIALVENLRRLSVQMLHARRARAKADALADRLLGLRGRARGGQRARAARARRRGTRPRVRRPARAAPARSGCFDAPRAGVAERTPRCAGHDVGRRRGERASGAGRGERHRAERDQQHALDVLHRLARVLREREPGRRGAAQRARVLGDGLRDARRVPEADRDPLARLGAVRARGRGRAPWSSRARPRRRGPARRSVPATPSSQAAGATSSGSSASASSRGWHSSARAEGTRSPAISVRSRSSPHCRSAWLLFAASTAGVAARP